MSSVRHPPKVGQEPDPAPLQKAGRRVTAADRPTPVPTGDPSPPRFAPPDEPNQEQERYAVACAWHTLTKSTDDVALARCPLVATLFAVVATSYEGAEDDPPVMGVLMAIRQTAAGWLNSCGEGAALAELPFTPFTDLSLMLRRIDVAMALARSDARRRDAR